MIQLQTKVNIIDNTGGLVGRCIKTKYSRVAAGVSDVILISILKSTGTIRKGEKYSALVVRTVKEYHGFRSSDNAVLLISNKSAYDPMGTRLRGAISSKISKKYLKFLSIGRIII